MYATKVLRITLSALHLFLSSVKFWVSLVAITKKKRLFSINYLHNDFKLY